MLDIASSVNKFSSVLLQESPAFSGLETIPQHRGQTPLIKVSKTFANPRNVGKRNPC